MRRFFPVLISLCLLAGGCAQKPEPPPTMKTSEAQKAFEKKCREDFDLQVSTRLAGRTLYIYYPTDKPMFDYEAQKENASFLQDKKKIKYAVEYMDVKYQQGHFDLEYDIVDKKKSAQEDPGYTTSYSESYSKAQSNLFVALSEVFLNTADSTEEPLPEFMVLIITDIKKGIEARLIFNLDDFQRASTGDLPSDEFYTKRILADTKGGQSLIGDEVGTHIEYKDISMGEFLSKQIANRVQFKFQRSDFPPEPDFDDTVIGIVADTTRYYQFKDFQEVRLNNLRSGKKFTFNREQLASFGEDKDYKPEKASKGKLIHIIFEDGKARFADEDANRPKDSQP